MLTFESTCTLQSSIKHYTELLENIEHFMERRGGMAPSSLSGVLETAVPTPTPLSAPSWLHVIHADSSAAWTGLVFTRIDVRGMRHSLAARTVTIFEIIKYLIGRMVCMCNCTDSTVTYLIHRLAFI